MFSRATVASSTKIPTARLSPPSVITLIVLPVALSTRMEQSIASGIETTMISVDRQLPRNKRITSAVRQPAIIVSLITPCLDAIHDVHRTGSGAPQYSDEGCPNSVLTHDVCLNSVAVMDLSHIAQVDD